MEKVQGARIPDLDRKKYLVPGDLTGEENSNDKQTFFSCDY